MLAHFCGRYRFWLGLLLVTALFAVPLYRLVIFALGSSLYSHIPLIPLVSLYFAWVHRHAAVSVAPQRSSRSIQPNRREGEAPPVPLRWPAEPRGGGCGDPLSISPMVPHLAGDDAIGGATSSCASRHALARLPAILGGLLVAVLLWTAFVGVPLAPVDFLALSTGAWVVLVRTTAAFVLDRATLRTRLFPLCFLVFMVPLPTAVENVIETVLQHGSAEAAHGMFRLSGATLLRDGLVFQLPGFSMQVAPQCSGIHSSLVLFITSVVAGKVFLISPWRRVALTAFVLPLALLRNGFRVWTLGTLGVNVGPEVLHSWIHRQGGPLFFAFSLLPFFAILLLLWRTERPRGNGPLFGNH